ncbi:MAG: hypothetical protein AB7J40_04065 [Candidatus Altimarinota bacterium]
MNPSPGSLRTPSDHFSRPAEVSGVWDVGRYLASVREALVEKCSKLFASIRTPEVAPDQLRNALSALSFFIPEECEVLRAGLVPPEDADVLPGDLKFDLAKRTFTCVDQTLPLADLFQLDEVPLAQLVSFRDRSGFPLGHREVVNKVEDMIKDPDMRTLVQTLYEELCLAVDDRFKHSGEVQKLEESPEEDHMIRKEPLSGPPPPVEPPSRDQLREQRQLSNWSFLTRLQAVQLLDEDGDSRVEPDLLRRRFVPHFEDILKGRRGPESFLAHFPRAWSEKERSILSVLGETVDVDPMLWMDTRAWILGRVARFPAREILYEVLTSYPLAAIFSARGIAPEAQQKHYDDLLQLVSYSHVPTIPDLAAKSALCWEQYEVGKAFAWTEVAQRRMAVSFEEEPASQDDHLTYLYLKIRGLLSNDSVRTLSDLVFHLMPQESKTMVIRKNGVTNALLSDRWGVMNKVYRAAFDTHDQGLEMQLMSILFHRLQVWSEKDWNRESDLFTQLKALSYHLQQFVDLDEERSVRAFLQAYESRFHVLASTNVGAVRKDFEGEKKLLGRLAGLLNGMRMAQREVRMVMTRLLVGMYPGLYGKMSEGRFLIDIGELCPELLWNFGENHLVMPFLINGGVNAFLLPTDEGGVQGW